MATTTLSACLVAGFVAAASIAVLAGSARAEPEVQIAVDAKSKIATPGHPVASCKITALCRDDCLEGRAASGRVELKLANSKTTSPIGCAKSEGGTISFYVDGCVGHPVATWSLGPAGTMAVTCGPASFDARDQIAGKMENDPNP